MARNLFVSALLGGAEGWAEDQQRKEDYLFRLREQEAMRDRLMDQQQAYRTGGSGGSSGARVAAQPQTAAQVNDDINVANRMTDQEIIDQAGGATLPHRVADGYTQSGSSAGWEEAEKVAMSDKRRGSNAAVEALPDEPDRENTAKWTDKSGRVVDKPEFVLDRDNPLVQEKIEELRLIRQLRQAGPNADDYAKGMETMTKRNLLERAGKGDKNALVGTLASHGKGEFDNMNDAGTFSQVTGSQNLNKVANAKAAEHSAKANENNAQAGLHTARKKAIEEGKSDDPEKRRAEAEDRRKAEGAEKAAATNVIKEFGEQIKPDELPGRINRLQKKADSMPEGEKKTSMYAALRAYDMAVQRRMAVNGPSEAAAPPANPASRPASGPAPAKKNYSNLW